MLDESLLTEFEFKLSSEENLNMLVQLNAMIVKRIQFVQYLQQLKKRVVVPREDQKNVPI